MQGVGEPDGTLHERRDHHLQSGLRSTPGHGDRTDRAAQRRRLQHHHVGRLGGDHGFEVRSRGHDLVGGDGDPTDAAQSSQAGEVGDGLLDEGHVDGPQGLDRVDRLGLGPGAVGIQPQLDTGGGSKGSAHTDQVLGEGPSSHLQLE